jgi:hypothetical protein
MYCVEFCHHCVYLCYAFIIYIIRISLTYLKYPLMLCFVSTLYVWLYSAIIADVGASTANLVFCV